jgi:formylglycine-generating enzyme required for sulfatase activity
VNSLGMKFVSVPISGANQPLLVCVWETREQDYLRFVNERDVPWPKQNFGGPTYPAVRMNWEEAGAFCEWLTEKERRAGRISADHRYRLPSDHEWSCAVGLGDREDPARTPEEKNCRILNVYPWGVVWPPPLGAGNYSGEEAAGHELWGNQKIIPGYRDAFTEAAPVGSLQPNRLGIHDLGGNVHEWCEDSFSPESENRVLRGGSFVNDTSENLLSSYRLNIEPGERGPAYGFRIVLDGPPLPPAAPAGAVVGTAAADGGTR